MTTCMAGSEPVLPLVLAASGMLPGISEEESRAAAERLRGLDPALLGAVEFLEKMPPGISEEEARTGWERLQRVDAENAAQELQRVFDRTGFLR